MKRDERVKIANMIAPAIASVDFNAH